MKKRILVVEYDAQTVDLIHETFPQPVFDITVVDEGQKARDILAKNSFDLVITAAMLPKFHGFNLSQFIHEQYPNIRVIIMSGIYKEMEYKRQAITQYNADDFFQKPLNKDTLRRRVFELLELDATAQSASEGIATTEFPVSDTSKMPALTQDPLPESNRFSSDDLFGDIIEKVETEDDSEVETPQQKPVQTTAETITRKDKKPEPEEEGVLDLTDADMVSGSPKTIKMPASQPQPSSFKAITSDDIDASLNNLLSDKQPKTADTKRFKKIEEDFSKKFEDTLSGLGLDKKRKKPDPVAADKSQFPSAPAHEPPAPSAPQVDQRTQEMPRAVEAPPPVKAPSSELGDYDILGLIARGGMAEIYKAKKKGVKGFEKVLAIKKILSGYGQDDKYIEMFVDEAKIAAELTHPNIVQIYDLGKKDDYYFIAMEYVQGKDLRVILKRIAGRERVFPEELSVYLTIKVLEALNYAHSAKDSKGSNLDIVHRDISPPNIMISYGGEVKLTDFGVSKATIKVHQTLSGALKGKLLYMSPEQARAERDIDHRSDIYSVGIILFELLTGQKLFMETSEMKVLKRVQQGQITPPSETGVAIDPELERILLKSLSLEREERYQSASDMLSDLESYLLSMYDHIPGYLHLAHFMNDLFGEDMSREGVKLALKPLPYSIKRLPRKLSEPRPPEEEEKGDDLRVETTRPEELPPVGESMTSAEMESESPSEPEIEFLTLDEEDELPQPPMEKYTPEQAKTEAPEPPPGVQEVEEKEAPFQTQAMPPEAPGLPETPALDEEPEEESRDSQTLEKTPDPGSVVKTEGERRPTFEIKLEDELPESESVEGTLQIDEELAALNKTSRRRSWNFLLVLLVLAAVAAGVVWLMMNRTGEPQTELTPPATEISRTESATPQETPDEMESQALDNSTEADILDGVLASTVAEEGTESAPEDTRAEDAPLPSKPEISNRGKTRTEEKPRAVVPDPKTQASQVSEPVRRETPPEKVSAREEAQTRKQTASSPQTETVSTTAAKPPAKEEKSQSTETTQTQPPTETKPEDPLESPPEEKSTEQPPAAKEAPPQEIVREGRIASSVDTMPVAISTPYPELSRRSLRGLKSGATVVISFLVNHLGKVERIKFIRRSGSPEIDMEIARAVSSWTYRPAVKQGKKVKLWQTKSIAVKK
ncbi:MAG TPA: response regulator [Candidatus Aminicenantes bacterium]|nr:response regulator [Candidatus Aminicenantes bacterium]